jgi:SagB-type dehydrogenase family enzyme
VTEASALPTPRLAPQVFHDGPGLDDPAELLHEASKLQPALVPRQMRGVLALERSDPLKAATVRAVRRTASRPTIELPAPLRPPMPIMDAIAARRSMRDFDAAPLGLEEVATLLHAGYGVVEWLPTPSPSEPQGRRAVPSGGALYPLELYVLPLRVDGLQPALHHYDATTHRLARLPHALDPREISVDTDAHAAAAAIVFVAAVFWRSRFKYGVRAYRFTLLEAGHVCQNVLLAAAALGLGSVVVGGFYDAIVDEALGLDGLHDSTLVTVCVGRPAAGEGET